MMNPEASVIMDAVKTPQTPGNAIYRCQRCGKDDVMATPTLERAIQATLQGGAALPFYTYHNCADGGLGVCQLVGGVYPNAGEALGPPRSPRDMKLAQVAKTEAPVPASVAAALEEAALASIPHQSEDAVADTPQPETSDRPTVDTVKPKRTSAINRLAAKG
jgi:hypothetical protein